jgi:hypothetical protein
MASPLPLQRANTMSVTLVSVVIAKTNIQREFLIRLKKLTNTLRYRYTLSVIEWRVFVVAALSLGARRWKRRILDVFRFNLNDIINFL